MLIVWDMKGPTTIDFIEKGATEINAYNCLRKVHFIE